MFEKNLNYLSFPSQDLERCYSILWALEQNTNEHVSKKKIILW